MFSFYSKTEPTGFPRWAPFCSKVFLRSNAKLFYLMIAIRKKSLRSFSSPFYGFASLFKGAPPP